MNKTRSFLGFTVPELLIVISVIGILASIVLLVYPGYQMRARNAERKSDVGQVAAALGTYALQKNNYVGTGSGCGLNGNGNGWLAAGPSESGAGSYPKSILTCLNEADILAGANFVDPSGCLWASGGTCGSSGGFVKAYMKATCTKSGTTVSYVFAYLESEPQKVAEVDALCDSGTVSGFTATSQKWGTNYGMNYYTTVR
jgi:prepilin-type N-terminal cleavage/methylation domain-containing protein